MSTCRDCEAPTVRRTVLCETHYREALRRVAEPTPPKRARKPRTVAPPLTPAPAAIDPTDILKAEGWVPAHVRALHLARWLHRHGAPVRRADAVKVCGLRPATSSSSSSAIADVGVSAGWIVRGPLGSLAPGPVKPPDE